MLALFSLTLAPCIAASYAVEDYTFMWWPYGFRGRSPQGDQVLCIQTGAYALAIEANKASISHLGPIADPLPYSEAVSQDNSVVFSLPKPVFDLGVTVGGVRYAPTRAASVESQLEYPVRMIDSGRFVQRVDIQQVEFADTQGRKLPADGRLEITAWPDRLALTCEITPKEDLDDGSIAISLDGRSVESRKGLLRAGVGSSASIAWAPGQDSLGNSYGSEVAVAEMTPAATTVPVRYDPICGHYRIEMPTPAWGLTDDPDRLDRYSVKLSNSSDGERVFRLLFSYDKTAAGSNPILPAIVGMSPMLRDSEGNPSGIPVQISKDWHAQPDLRLLYEGPWFHGYTVVRVPAKSEWRGEFDMAYAHWGGLPAVSHAQLCLIGYAMNQIWDEMAIGSWGESICYDPDVNLQRSMIDDVRPLLTSTDGKPQWGFGNNVGGGDFLVYFDAQNHKQFLSRVRTAYLRYGPNLSEVIYSGASPDGAIAARITASSPRCDDMNKAYYHLRYDVKKRTRFTRLAFFQIASDNYSDHQFTTIARGSVDKAMVEEWETGRGGLKYLRDRMACEGETPWFSLHGGIPSAPKGMENCGWANRGLIIRSWKAKLGGKSVPVPYASIYGSENGIPSALLELSPPPGLTELQPGDYVEADLEMLIVPASTNGYFGPNESLRADLKKNANTWRPVLRIASGNSLKVEATKGTVVRRYPVVVKTDAHGHADFTVTGGIGYVPVSITGLKSHAGSRLWIERDGTRTPVDQSVHGSDFWQTDFDPRTKTFTRTYNIPLDTAGVGPSKTRLILEPSP